MYTVLQTQQNLWWFAISRTYVVHSTSFVFSVPPPPPHKTQKTINNKQTNKTQEQKSLWYCYQTHIFSSSLLIIIARARVWDRDTHQRQTRHRSASPSLSHYVCVELRRCMYAPRGEDSVRQKQNFGTTWDLLCNCCQLFPRFLCYHRFLFRQSQLMMMEHRIYGSSDQIHFST